MSRDFCYSLCQRIIRYIGERQFKSESCIDAFLDCKDIMFITNIETTGGFISDEVKLAMSDHLLDADDDLDLVVIFDIHSDHCPRMLCGVLLSWVIVTRIRDSNMKKYLVDKDAMEKVSKGFVKRSNSVFKRSNMGN